MKYLLLLVVISLLPLPATSSAKLSNTNELIWTTVHWKE